MVGVENMPLVTDKVVSGFKVRTVWFGDQPYDEEGFDSITHMYCKEKVDAQGFTRETLSTLVIDLGRGLDAVWTDMAGDCRKWIRRAEKEGFKVSFNKDHDLFIRMNDEFRRSKGLPPYRHTREYIQQYCTLLTAEVNGETLCGYLAIHDDRYMRGLQAVSKRLDVDDAQKKLISFGNRLLVWEAIQYASSKGVAEYDLGGYYIGETPDPEMEGINRFKRGFGGQLVERHSYTRDYSMAAKAARKLSGTWNRLKGH